MQRRIAIGLLIFANLVWGSNSAVAKVALAELPPPLVGGLRVTIAALPIWLLVCWQSLRPGPDGRAPGFERIPLRDRLQLFGLGILGMAVNYLLSYWGISLTTVTDTALMIIGEVMMTTLLAVWWLGERLSRRKLSGFGFGLVGVALLIFSSTAGAGGGGAARALGDLLVLGGLFAASLYSVFGARFTRTYRLTTILGNVYIGGLIIWLPLLLGFYLAGAFPRPSAAALGAVLYLALVPSVICQLIWLYALRVGSANLGAISLLIQPLLGATIGALAFGDPLTPGVLAGGALIFIGLYLSAFEGRAARVNLEPHPLPPPLPGEGE